MPRYPAGTFHALFFHGALACLLVPAAGAAPPDAAPPSRAPHWAFRPVTDPRPPAVRDAAWPAGDLDRFILAKLEEKGLAPAPEADRRTLVRRMTFDLLGLPPEPEEVDAFVRDTGEDALDRLIERLLASPHYGERWGRHWLDVARYADTAGDSSDYPVPQLYRYRNWVIRSVGDDKPFDRFIREQVAGDLLPSSTPDERLALVVATGYIALAKRFASDSRAEFHHTLDNAVDTLGISFLGLSLSCARCHDHKFDPIPSRDYYALYGIFSSTRFPFPGCEHDKRPSDLVPLIPMEEVARIQEPFEARLKEIAAEVSKLDAELKPFNEARRKNLPLPPREPGSPSVEELRETMRSLIEKRGKVLDEIPQYEKAYAVAEGNPANARIQTRGDPGDLGEEVPRGFLTALGGGPIAEPKGSGRLELADWLASPSNPLTARVMANRIWLHHFGKGIVATPNDFGRQGSPPSHPELLDWLASRFIEDGWSVKAMHRRILKSRTYRMSSTDDPANRLVDPAGDYLWRFRRSRLDAESLRDAMLAVSGELDRSMGGPHPFPAEKTWKFTQHNQFSARYDTNRRSVYLMTPRLQRHPFLALFDGPDPNGSTGQRGESTTPIQALFAMNDPFVHERAAGFSRRILEVGTSDEDRIRAAFRFGLSRDPDRAELEDVRAALAALRERGGAGDPGDADRAAFESVARVILESNEFFYVD